MIIFSYLRILINQTYRAFPDLSESMCRIAHLVNIHKVIPRSDSQQMTVRREPDNLNRFLAILVNGQLFSRLGVKHQPLSGQSANGYHPTVRRKRTWLHLLANILAPDYGMRQRIPQLQQSISTAGYELRHIRVHGQSPQLVGVSHYYWRQIQVKGSSQNTVASGSDQQLRSLALGDHANSTEVMFDLDFDASCIEILLE